MKKIDNPFLIDNMPYIDLHGYDRVSALIELNSFIIDNIKLNNKYLVVIHGKGEFILRKEVHEYLRKDKRIKEFKLDYFNDGVTIVKLV